jgi:hypothetical protein
MLQRTLFHNRIGIKKATFLSMGVYLFVLNLPHMVTIREASFFLAIVLAALALFMEGEWQLTPLKFTFLLWLGVALVSLWASDDVSNSLREIKKEVLYFILSFWLFYTMTRNRKDLIFLSYFILASATLIIAASMYHYYMLGHGIDDMYRLGVLYGERNYYSFFMLSTGLLCLAIYMLDDAHKTLRTYCLLLLPFCILAIYFARLRAGYLSIVLIVCAIIGVKIYMTRGYKTKVALLSLIIFILFFSLMVIVDINLNWDMSVEVMKRYAAQERWTIWRHFIGNFIMEHPVLGVGFGNKDFAIPELGGRRFYPHNLFLSYGVMMGLPGMVVLGVIFVRLFRLLQKDLMRSYTEARQVYVLRLAGILILMTFFVQNLTADVMVRHTGLFFWAVMGMVLGSCRNHGVKNG